MAASAAWAVMAAGDAANVRKQCNEFGLSLVKKDFSKEKGLRLATVVRTRWLLHHVPQGPLARKFKEIEK